MVKTEKSTGGKIVSFRADVAVADAISKAAEARGLNSSDFIRTIMLKVLKPEKENADATAAKLKVLSPEAQKKVARARAIIKELRALRVPRPASNPLDDFFQDGEKEEVAGKIQALEIELADLKKAVGKEVSPSKGLTGVEIKKVERVGFGEEETEDEEAEDEKAEDEKSDAEKEVDGFLGIMRLVKSLQAVREKGGFLDNLFGGNPSIEDLLIKRFEAVVKGDLPDGEELEDLRAKSLQVIEKRKKIQELDEADTDKAEALAKALWDELESMRDDELADEKERKPEKGGGFEFWWER